MTYLNNLAKRLAGGFDSADGPHADQLLAYREVDNLRDVSIITEAATLLASERKIEIRCAIYHVLGKLSSNASLADATRLLLSRLDERKNRRELDCLLEAIANAHKPACLALVVVQRIIESSKGAMRRNAIRALGGSTNRASEEYVISLLQSSSDYDDIIECQAVLAKSGSTDALPALRESLRSKSKNVRISAEVAIERISRRQMASS